MAEDKEKRGTLIGLCGIGGLFICLVGLIEGYLWGFWSDHRAAGKAGRLISRAALMLTALAVAFTAISACGYDKKTPQNTDNIPIVQAEEEMPEEDPTEPSPAIDAVLLETLAGSIAKGSELDPIDDSIMAPADIYTEKGSEAIFHAYHPEAQTYQWEIYDTQKESWEKAPQEAIQEHTDELWRKVSTLKISSDTDRQIRCKISKGMKGEESYEASLHILPDQISSLAIATKEVSMEAGLYASAKEIPVEVTYRDGSKESITGLNDLYFLEQSESSETAPTSIGNSKEIITTVKTAREYTYIEPGSEKRMLRYQKGDKNVDIPVNITGLDQKPPQITELTISEFEVSKDAQDVPVTVTIQAVDDVTPLRNLVFAFKPEGEEPEEADWTKDSVFQTDITKNGIWVAYCRDEAGNTATKEQRIIATDTEAPKITLTLEKEAWCQENKIHVSAEDESTVEYRYLCEKTGEDSGWIKESAKNISKNGEWKIQVRDAVGNLAEQTITVDNIDTQAPVIRSIKEKTEKESQLKNEK